MFCLFSLSVNHSLYTIQDQLTFSSPLAVGGPPLFIQVINKIIVRVFLHAQLFGLSIITTLFPLG